VCTGKNGQIFLAKVIYILTAGFGKEDLFVRYTAGKENLTSVKEIPPK
jgi:hypothetical protein